MARPPPPPPPPPLPSRRAASTSPRFSLSTFVGVMLVVIAIQGAYLGYTIGVLTTLEKRFGFSSANSGMLLSAYDIGHTVAVLILGWAGSHYHLPRVCALGVALSAFAMFLFALPVLIFGTVNHDAEFLERHLENLQASYRCDDDRLALTAGFDCARDHEEHVIVYVMLMLAQIIAGVAAAPFNTVAYVYIDTNVEDRRKSPLLLGLLTSMFAFGPAIGFALSALLTSIYTTLGEAPPHVTPGSEHWVGCWWLGYLICGLLYLTCAPMLLLFPKTYRARTREQEMHPLNRDQHGKVVTIESYDDEPQKLGCSDIGSACKEFPYVVYDLARNKVYVSMVIAWMFGSYLIGGYNTYLPKYIETEFSRSASMADLFAGILSIGAIATSTAIGGWVLTRWDVKPRRALLLLLGTWILLTITYLAGMLMTCDQTRLEGLHYRRHLDRWHFTEPGSGYSQCGSSCGCNSITSMRAVHGSGMNFFSPCHAGCTNFDRATKTWYNCECTADGMVEDGLEQPDCPSVYAYVAVMFVGLFAGNLFFMTAMMIVLRSVYDDQKVVALSLASVVTNLLGFIPAPILFGNLIDGTCTVWQSKCAHDRGNCEIYDKDSLRTTFHITNAILQALAVICVGICYLFARRATLPEEEDYEGDPAADEPPPPPPPPHRNYAQAREQHLPIYQDPTAQQQQQPRKPRFVKNRDSSTR